MMYLLATDLRKLKNFQVMCCVATLRRYNDLLR